MHKNEQYLSDNCNVNVTGCDIISKSEMYMSFGKLSASSRQIQKIVFVMKNCVFTNQFKHKTRIMFHHFYRKVGISACTMFSCILGHTEENKNGCHIAYCCIENLSQELMGEKYNK